MYQIQHHRNPMKFIQILKHSKPKFENPFSRQYVFNGATFVPVPTDGSPPSSYLNSAKGGGLAPGARDRWTGATFIPVNPEDLPMVSDETEIRSQTVRNFILRNRGWIFTWLLWAGFLRKFQPSFLSGTPTHNLIFLKDAPALFFTLSRKILILENNFSFVYLRLKRTRIRHLFRLATTNRIRVTIRISITRG